MPRIFLGPGEIAGYFSALKAGFDQLGIDCDHYLLSENRYAYTQHRYFGSTASDLSVRLSRHRSAIVRLFGTALRAMIRLVVFVYAICRYDVFIFPGFGSLFKFYELPILKALGKRTIVVFLGSDARPPIFSGRHLDDEGKLVDIDAAHAETKRLFRRIRLIERYADQIINHTATDQFFTNPYVRFAAIGLPIRTAASDRPAMDGRSRIKIVHAPSRPIAKGTHFFRQVVAELEAAGFPIDYVELVGVSNKQVLDELSTCDFILDELYSDMPLAMFATEAAMFGKPAVVGGYYSADFERDNPDALRLPSLYVQPEDIKDAVERLVRDCDFRASLGRSASEFVHNHWSALSVAKRMLQVVNGDIPAAWMSCPHDHCYIWGWGLAKDIWGQQVGRFVDRYGIDGLHLGHNQRLVARIKQQLDTQCA